jgi:polysaccharide export outer membrane protein
MSKDLRYTLFVALAVTGCSLPGIHYDPDIPPAERAEPAPAPYSIQRVTPALLTSLRSAAAAVDTPRVNPELQQAANAYTYLVGPHDVINIIVWNHPELTISQAQATPLNSATGGILLTPPSAEGNGFVVSSAGTIYFPYAGTLKVAGETVDAIRAQLAQALQNYTKDAQIDVRVVGFRSRTYQLAGAVVKPGLYALTNVPLTVSQAIASAGGEIRSLPTSGSGTLTDLTSLPLADLSHVTLISGGRREVLDLRKFYLYGDQTQDRLVHAGDIIQVPNNTDDQVHVIGEVARQGNYPMSSGTLNLAQALGEAGGFNLTTADPARVFVFRGGADSSRVFWLDARSADAMLLATRFELQPQDVVYVATNGLSTWNRVIAQILPTVQTLYETKILVHP